MIPKQESYYSPDPRTANRPSPFHHMLLHLQLEDLPNTVGNSAQDCERYGLL